MQIIENMFAIKKHISSQKEKGKSVGYVPTMGCFNQTHIDMIQRAKKENDIAVVSIFVNMAQFENKSEYKSYPRDFESDYKKAEEAGADVLFYPDVSNVWSKTSSMFVDFSGPFSGMKTRGMATVLIKFLSAIDPDRVYISQKSMHELIVAERLVTEFAMSPNVIACPIARESDGLAISQENGRLSPQERDQAVVLNKALKYASVEIKHGERNAAHLKKAIVRCLQDATLGEIDHVSIMSYEGLKESIHIKDKVIVSVALKFPEVRLEDNAIINL